SIWRGVAHIPEFARDELIYRNTVLNDSLIAEKRIHIVTDDVAFEVRISANHRGSFSILPAFEPRAGNIPGQVENNGPSAILRPQIAGRVEGIGLAEYGGLQGQFGPVAIRAADVFEERFA